MTPRISLQLLRLPLLALLLLPRAGSAATIDLTDKVAYNQGLPSLTLDGATFTANPSGYLQFTGYGVGVCSAVGWSCNEAEFPERLTVSFEVPVTVTGLNFGYLQNQTPLGDKPGYLSTPEILVVEPEGHFPSFYAGTDFSGLRSVAVDFQNIRRFDVFGLGRVPGIWGEGLHAAALAGITFTPYTLPPPVPPVDPPPVPPVDPPVDPPPPPPDVDDPGPADPFDPPITVPGPGAGILSLIGMGGWVFWRRREQVRWVETPWGDKEMVLGEISGDGAKGLVDQLRALPKDETHDHPV